MLTLIITILFFLLLSALFSGSEIAFISANKLGIEVRRNSGSRRGKVLASFYDKPKEFISSMLVGNNIALVIFTTFMTSLLTPFILPFVGEGAGLLLINTLLISIVILVFGEFLPKTIFRLFSGELLYFLTYPLYFFKWILLIPTKLMSGLSELVIKYVFRSNTETEDYRLTRLDLQHYITHSVKDEDEEIEKELFINALNLKQIRVRDCMIPRKEMVVVDVGDSISDLIETFSEFRHSRILVMDGDVDHIIGYVHHQGLLQKPKTIKRILRPIPFVPEAMNVQELLSYFMKDGSSIACVVDEYGGTSGLITIEDIQEEIFGEIEDEHDQEDYVDIQISETEYLFSGRMELSQLNEKYENLNFPDGDYQTLSGYIVMTTGTIPPQGTVVEMSPYRFVLELVSDTKIETVRVFVLEVEEF